MRKLFLLLLLPCISPVSAQPYLKLEDALSRILEKNHNIILARQQVQISENNEGYGNAGFLPSVGLNAGANRSINDTKQRFVSGQDVNRKGATSSTLTGSIALNWTLFDGMRMFATYKKAEENTALNRLGVKSEIENQVAQAMQLYYAWVQQYQLIQAQKSAIRVSDERIKIASGKLEIGNGNKLDLLQAQLDKNAQLSEMEFLEQEIIRLQSELNVLQGISPSLKFLPSDTLPLSYTKGFDSLRTVVFHQNNQLKMLEKNISIRQQEHRELKASYLPVVGLNLSYGLNRTQNEVGFLLFNNTYSLFGGLSASWILYDGGVLQKQNQIRLLELAKAETLFDQMRLNTEGKLQIAWEKMNRQKTQVQREEENLRLAEQALEIALERFRVGSSTSLELMSVQQSYAQAGARLATARFALSASVTELLLLDGSLVQAD